MGMEASALAVLPFSVSSRVIRKLYGETHHSGGSSHGGGSSHSGGSLSFNHVKDVLVLCMSDNPSASLSLPGMVVYREYDRVIFDAKPKETDEEFAPVYPTVGNSFIILGLGLKITCKSVICDDNMYKNKTGDRINTSFTTFVFKSIDICGKISVRSRREGDLIRLKGQSGTKTLKKLFIEKRIPVRKRNLIPVICDEEGVLGIYKTGTGDRAVPKPGDSAIMIIFEEIGN